LVLVFTGNGKGKTTAAIGQAIRVLGNGKRAALVQFIKSPKWPTGEEVALLEFGRRCKVCKGGKGFVGIMGDNLPKSIHKAAARKTWEEAKKYINSGRFSLVILDEINVAAHLGLLRAKEVANILKKYKLKYRFLDIILTGRSAPKEFILVADLVTEFKEIKHPFQKGKWGEKGREY